MLLDSFFGSPVTDRFKREADHIEGAMSILTGVAANKSIASGLPIRIDDLIRIG